MNSCPRQVQIDWIYELTLEMIDTFLGCNYLHVHVCLKQNHCSARLEMAVLGKGEDACKTSTWVS